MKETAGTPLSCKVDGIWKGSLKCACGQHKGNAGAPGGQMCSVVLPGTSGRPGVWLSLLSQEGGIVGIKGAFLGSLRL